MQTSPTIDPFLSIVGTWRNCYWLRLRNCEFPDCPRSREPMTSIFLRSSNLLGLFPTGHGMLAMPTGDVGDLYLRSSRATCSSVATFLLCWRLGPRPKRGFLKTCLKVDGFFALRSLEYPGLTRVTCRNQVDRLAANRMSPDPATSPRNALLQARYSSAKRANPDRWYYLARPALAHPFPKTGILLEFSPCCTARVSVEMIEGMATA